MRSKSLWLAFGFLLACSDSKADLTLTTYQMLSDCAGSPAQGQMRLTQESPNVFRAVGGTAFGFPDELIHREDQGLLQSSSTTRACRTRAYKRESELLFVCFALPAGIPECTIRMSR